MAVPRFTAALAGVLVLAAAARAVAGEPSAKRALPDYDGRPPSPPDARATALFVPRLLLSPLYLTSEYLIRRPLAVAIPAAERRDLPRKVYDFFLFGRDHKAGVVPVGFVEFGFRPSVGAYAFWDDAFVPGHDLRLHAETWGRDWLAGSFTERVGSPTDVVELRVAGSHRPDWTFHGIGPRTPASARARYGEDLVDAALRIEHHGWRLSGVQYGVGLRSARFHPGGYDDDPTVVERAAAGLWPLPDGMATGYTAPYHRLLAVLDSRRPWPSAGSGVRARLMVEQGADVQTAPLASWLRYDVGAGWYADLTGARRVLSVSGAVMFADPLGPRPVPFTELVGLGGEGGMRGFSGRRMVGRSGAVLTTRYEWPVGPWLAGTISAAAGNVFDSHLTGLRPSLLRLSGAVGLAAFSLDQPFELLVGVGTDPFADGGRISSVVATLGVNRGP